METIRIECTGAGTLALHMLTPLQGDLKTLSDENYKRLKFEILEEGFSFPVAVWENPQDAKIYICDGHQRVETLNRMKEDGYIIPQIPVVMVEAESLNQAKRKLLGAASQYGEYNQEGAEKFIQTIQGMDLTELGSKFIMPSIDFGLMNLTPQEGDKIEVSAHLRSASTPVEGQDDVPELHQTKIQLGDLFQLGRHRLLCGDSTNAVQVERLMGGLKCDLLFTDPPYRMSVEGGSNQFVGRAAAALGDRIKDLCNFEPEKFLEVIPNLFNKGIFNAYIFCNKDLVPDYLNWAKNSGFSFNILFWKKPNGIPLGGSHRPDVEYLILIRKSAVWNNNVEGVSYSKCLEFKRVNETENVGDHPTPKPVQLIVNEILISSNADSIVVDLFGGSGSTLIACENVGRICNMMEFDPQYVQVIIDRWEKFTGQKAIKL
jgi:site-specific DNA-methyltransferase (adenine-specific)